MRYEGWSNMETWKINIYLRNSPETNAAVLRRFSKQERIKPKELDKFLIRHTKVPINMFKNVNWKELADEWTIYVREQRDHASPDRGVSRNRGNNQGEEV